MIALHEPRPAVPCALASRIRRLALDVSRAALVLGQDTHRLNEPRRRNLAKVRYVVHGLPDRCRVPAVGPGALA